MRWPKDAVESASRYRYAVMLTVAMAFFGERPLIAQDDPRIPVANGQDGKAPLGEQQPIANPAAPSPSQATPPAQPGRGQIPFKRLSDIDLNIQPPGKLLPADEAMAFFGQASQDADAANREWANKEFTWEAPGLCYRPLYFEEVGLERHGYSFGVAQPAVSSAQFFGRSLALPGLMAIQPPHECIYPLGHDRPGDSAPYYIYGPLGRR